jgi:hypothetical protein
MNDDDFYIGYLPEMAASSARPVRRFVAAAFAAAAAVCAVWLAVQNPFDRAFFDFGNVREFRGTVRDGAVPFLIIDEENAGGPPAPRERAVLVSEGKHGFDAARFDGRRVVLRGTRIERDGLLIVEVESGSVSELGTAAADEAGWELVGEFTLRGEIVDSKCYLGVMNPGRSKPHRDCAVACIRGGIPPLFIVHDEAGRVSELWLVRADGGPLNAEVLGFVAEPVEISGAVTRRGDHLRLAVAGLRRVAE